MAKLEFEVPRIVLPVNYEELGASGRRVIREEYVRVQQGLCYHCNNPLDGEPSAEALAMPVTKKLYPPNFFKWPVHLHHDHNTGMTIGAVHCHCNAVLWEHHGE